MTWGMNMSLSRFGYVIEYSKPNGWPSCVIMCPSWILLATFRYSMMQSHLFKASMILAFPMANAGLRPAVRPVTCMYFCSSLFVPGPQKQQDGDGSKPKKGTKHPSTSYLRVPRVPSFWLIAIYEAKWRFPFRHRPTPSSHPNFSRKSSRSQKASSYRDPAWPLTLAARHDQLCAGCPNKWKSTKTYGLEQAKAADALAFDACLQIRIRYSEGILNSGILVWYFCKCFDTIPIDLALQRFNHRGADSGVRGLTGWYRQHLKCFQLKGSYTKAYRPANGIIQGGPMSMLVLTSLMTWVEHCQKAVPEAHPRSYADDLSLCTKSRTKNDLILKTKNMHQVTADFISTSGMAFDPDTCFTFGHPSVPGSIGSIQNHKSQHRLVGGSIELDKKKGWTEVEQKRAETWQKRIENIRFLPIGWFQNLTLIDRIMSRLTFGQGTHKLHLPSQSATSLRATVIRTVLNATFYDASPAIIFTILAKPSVDPEFALNIATIHLFIRSISRCDDKQRILNLIIQQNQTFPIDGPIARFHQLYHHEINHDTIHKFLNNHLDKHKWQHDLRETYRKTMWMRTARDRQQHFSGIQDGINRVLSLALLKKLTVEADTIQSQLDAQHIASVDASHDPRPKLKVPRLLLSAGVQTPERDHQHRRRPGSVQCKCGNAVPTIFHISWGCSCYEDLREEIWQHMPRPIEQMPICFQYTTLIPSNLEISETQIMGVQKRCWSKYGSAKSRIGMIPQRTFRILHDYGEFFFQLSQDWYSFVPQKVLPRCRSGRKSWRKWARRWDERDEHGVIGGLQSQNQQKLGVRAYYP